MKKKVLSLVLTAAMVMSLAACGSDKNAGGDANTGNAEAEKTDTNAAGVDNAEATGTENADSADSVETAVSDMNLSLIHI